MCIVCHVTGIKLGECSWWYWAWSVCSHWQYVTLFELRMHEDTFKLNIIAALFPACVVSKLPNE